MRTTLIAPLTLACLLSLGACNRDPTPEIAKRASADDPVTQDVKQIEYGVRLAAANKRIDELERKVGALENTPQKLDLELLTQRMAALEVSATSVSSSVPTVVYDLEKDRSAANSRRASGEVSRTPIKAPKLTLPDLETKSRPATASEVKAFSAGPQG